MQDFWTNPITNETVIYNIKSGNQSALQYKHYNTSLWTIGNK